MNELNRAIADVKIPPRMAARPISDRGFPIPWFVTRMPDGRYDFRFITEGRKIEALRLQRCWLCGQLLGRYKTFVIGPMCAINRISSEPPAHLECARYAVRICPFLTHPRAQRNYTGDDPRIDAPGIMLVRNPVVSLIWTCASFRAFTASRGNGGLLFELHDAVGIEWWAEGRKAKAAEIAESISGGLPELARLADLDGVPGREALAYQLSRFEAIFPGLWSLVNGEAAA